MNAIIKRNLDLSTFKRMFDRLGTNYEVITPDYSLPDVINQSGMIRIKVGRYTINFDDCENFISIMEK
jgi:hypothetical protein